MHAIRLFETPPAPLPECGGLDDVVTDLLDVAVAKIVGHTARLPTTGVFYRDRFWNSAGARMRRGEVKTGAFLRGL